MTVKKLVVILSIIAIGSFAIAGMLLVIQGKDSIVKLSTHANPGSKNETRVSSPENIATININSVNENIHLIPSDGQGIVANLHGEVSNLPNSPTLTTTVIGDTLYIKIEHRFVIGLFNERNNLTLDVEVPRSFQGKVRTKTVSADLFSEDLTLNDFSAHSVSGNIHLALLTTSACIIDTVSGKVVLSDLRSNLKFNSVSGDLDVRYTNSNYDLSAESTSGHIKIRLPQEPNFNLKFNTISGKLNNDFSTVQTGGNQLSLNQDIGTGKNKFVVKTVSGDCQILKNL